MESKSKAPVSATRLTSAQRRIRDVLAAGGRLWHPYVRAEGPAFLVGPGPLQGARVRYGTIDRLCDLGVIEEIEDDEYRPMGSGDGDVSYRICAKAVRS